MSAISGLTATAALLLLCFAAYATGAPPPRPFNDSMLPANQRTGEHVPGLGKVMRLNTYLAPKKTNMETTFNIHRNFYEPVRGLKFKPGTMTRLSDNCREALEGQACSYGPYEYDLRRIQASGFKRNQRTVIMIPGYFSPDECDWIREARSAWLELDPEANVIDVSWSDSNKCTYSRAVAHTPLIARQVTIFLHYLAELSGTTLEDEQFLQRIHLIGHSLGAHISGFVGQDLGVRRVGRITGLDPAGPSFDSFGPSERLDRDDAQLVEVLHTNSGQMKYLNLLASVSWHALSSLPFADKLTTSGGQTTNNQEADTAWFGINTQLGHVDYYANNGRVQAGCVGVLHICDHKRANQIYVDLLNYERSLRRSQSTMSMLSLVVGGGGGGGGDGDSSPEVADSPARLSKINRLLAFKSPDYETFASGHNFALHCPELMDMSTHLQDKRVLRTFKNCSIPLLDLLRPVDELISELQVHYGIDFSPAAADQATPTLQRHAYYFKTSSDEGKLIGDHYLVKIYLNEAPLWDAARCSLKSQVIMNDGEKIQLELSGHLRMSDERRILALPFVHLDSSKSKDQFNNLMKLVHLLDLESDDDDDEDKLQEAQEYKSQYKPSADFTQVLQDLFPRKLKLTLETATPKSVGVFGMVKAMTIKMLKSSDDLQQLAGLPVCRLSINMIEVHPLVYGLRRNFGALYGRDLFICDNPTGNSTVAGNNDDDDDDTPTLRVLSVGEQARRLQDKNKLLVHQLDSNSIKSLCVGLESALIG